MALSRRQKRIKIFWYFFATLMIFAMIGFLLLPLLYA